MPQVDNQKKTFTFPNKAGRIYLRAIEEIIGQNGLIAVLRLCGLTNYIGQIPPNNFDRGFRFEDMAIINETLEKVYGPDAGRGISLRSGHAAFKYGLREFSDLLGMNDLSFRLLPINLKIKSGLQALADFYNDYTDMIVRMEETATNINWHIDRCPYCWQRTSTRPSCYHMVGILQEALFWISNGKYFRVEETNCISMGDPSCTIQISRHPFE